MKSNSISKHWMTLEQQREQLFPLVESLTGDQLWHRQMKDKWSIGETLYHIYLFTKWIRIILNIAIPVMLPFAYLIRKVNNIEEDVAGHIWFFDPIAYNPNLIQAIQLMALHELHHFKTIYKAIEAIKNERHAVSDNAFLR